MRKYATGAAFGAVIALVLGLGMTGQVAQIERAELLDAAERGDVQRVDMLLRCGADVNARNGAGWAALHRAAAGGHSHVVARLLEGGADKDARTDVGVTALTLALQRDRDECIEILRRNRARE